MSHLDQGNPDTEDHPPVSVDRCPNCNRLCFPTWCDECGWRNDTCETVWKAEQELRIRMKA